MKKIYLFIKVIILLTFICSYSSAETFQKELSQLNTLNDVTKCVKNYIKSMGKSDARNYCVKKNLKTVDELNNVISGWGRWIAGSDGNYKEFGIKISNLHPNVFFGSIKIRINLKSKSKKDKYFTSYVGPEVDFHNLLINDYIKDPGLHPFAYIDISDLNIKNGDISGFSILEAKAIKIAEYKKLFSNNNLNNLEKCIKNNSKPDGFFKDYSLFEGLDVKSACIYELSVEAKYIDKKVNLKIVEKNGKIAISLENKIDNDFIITAGNLLLKSSNCDNKKYQQESDEKNPIWENATITEDLFPGYFMTQFTDHEFEKYLMPGEKFITPYDDATKKTKYCDYKPVIQTARILHIE